MNPRRAGLRILLFSILMLSGTGCVTRYRLEVLHETTPPKLDGSTIAVLPPFAAPGAEQAAIVGRRAAEAAFCGPIGSVRFLGPDRTVEASPIGGHDFAALRRSMVDLDREGPQPRAERQAWLFHGDRVGSVALRRSIDVSLARAPAAASLPSSESLDPGTLAGIPADYVLLSIALVRYQQVSRTTALVGLLPLFWSQDLQATRPASLFLLYETTTGRRVWEAVVATSGLVQDTDPRYAKEVVDSRIMPVLGAAHLLTGEFELPLARALEAPVAARRGRSGAAIVSDCLAPARTGH